MKWHERCHILGDIEAKIEALETDMNNVQMTIKDALETLKNNRRELK